MLGQAAPFLGQGGIDPRMVSGPSSDYMNQMASLPIWAGGTGASLPPGVGQVPPIYAQRGRVPAGGGQSGGWGTAMPQWPGWRDGAMAGDQGGGWGVGMPQGGGWGDMARQLTGWKDGVSGTDVARMGIDNGQTQGPMGGQGGGGMPSYLGGGMEQPYTRMATALGDAGSGPNYAQQWGQQPNAGPASWGPGTGGGQPGQQQPFRPQGPGQLVTQEQLAARGLNPQEIQRRLQQFAGGQLGWQRGHGGGGQGGGGQGGGQGFEGPNNGMPNGRPDMNDPRVQEFIRRMTGNPVSRGGFQGIDNPKSGPVPYYGGNEMASNIRRMVPQDDGGYQKGWLPPGAANPYQRQGMPRPPAGPDYGNDMIARPIPPQQPPMRPGMQNRQSGGAGAGRMPRADRPQIPRMG